MHEEVILSVLEFATANDFAVLGLTYSPIRGPEGNIEYLAHLKKGISENEGIPDASFKELAKETVLQSHGALEH